MNDYVVDATVVVTALAVKDAEGMAMRMRIEKSFCHAPHLLDAEVGSVLRRRERTGEISTEAAETALAALPSFVEYRYPHSGRLAKLAWASRHTITFYDGLYVALATLLELPLLTADVKLSKAPGLSCAVEVFS